MRRAPGIAIAAIGTLAVGIGATAAVFSFVAAVMSAAAPSPDMDRLVALWSHQRSEAETKGLVTPADFLEWSARAQSFEIVAAWRGVSFNVSAVGSPVRASGQLVTPGYLRVFGWQPVLGRGFTESDALPGAPKVMVASYAFWQNTLGGRPEVIGQSLLLDGERTMVIGVLPRMPATTGFFVPMSLADQREDRSSRTLFVHARLKPGLGPDAAASEMSGIAAALERDYPATHRGWTINVRPLQEEFIGPQARLVFAMLSAMVFIVLIIGCVNIANLLLARGVARRGELALRLALGAGRWRIVRQLLTECALLAFIGGLLSIPISRWTFHVLMSLGAIDSPWTANGGTNLRVVALTAVMSLVATVCAGLAPALVARRSNLTATLEGTSRSSITGSRRIMRTLVATQVALAVTLLVVAGLATRTLIAIEQLEPGFEIDDSLTASVTLPEAMPLDAVRRWMEEALTRARRLPGVVSAGATSRLPFAGGRWNPNRGLEIEGQASAPSDESRFAVDYVISPGLIESLGVPLRTGRVFTDSDGADAAPVAVVNETMARRFWPSGSPLGARLRRGDDPPGLWRTVVGVVGDIRNDDADQPPLPYLYLPLAQEPRRTMTFTLRSAFDPAGLAPALRASIAEFDPNQPLYDVRTMRDVWEEDLRGTRILIQVMGALAIVALGFAGIGIWGVAAQSVGQRTREIGVRMALGATAPGVAAMIAAQAVLPLGVGLTLGLLAGLGLGRVMRSILFQVSPSDPLTVVATLTALALVALMATLGPAIRAARLDPVRALRVE
jgi:predicted permease